MTVRYLNLTGSFVAAVALVVASTVSPASPPREQPVPNELPRSWNFEEIAKKTPPYGDQGRVYVLAWKVEEDGRPFRVESCLVLKVIEDKEGYLLAHLYRHPNDEEPKWDLSTLHVSGEKGTKYFPGLEIHHDKKFKDRPRNKDIYDSLSIEELGWSFAQESDWKFVSCCVCEKSWEEAVGEKPTRFFGR
jgi:hypothetical protein